MLTTKQRDLLVYIHEFMQREGVPPSFEEMRIHLDLKSKSGIHRLIGALAERGFIRRLPNRARALEVIRLPDTHEDAARLAAAQVTARTAYGGLADNSLSGVSRQEVSAANDDDDPSVISLPLYGRIAAGLPIEAIRQETETLDVPAALLGPGEHYALEVQGDSMIDLAILDGDIALIRKEQTARPGDIIVALVKGEEVTLKTLKRRGNLVGLEAANEAYETRWLDPSEVAIQGRLAGIWRRYL